MLKKIVFLVFLSIIGSISIVNAAAEYINAFLYPVGVMLNGQKLEFDSNDDILNYKNRAYVPVRQLIEKAGGRVGYDDGNKQISIDFQNASDLKPSLNNQNENNEFVLSIHSQKESYTSKEPIMVWGTLNYQKDASIVVQHADPLIKFTIKDTNGLSVSSSTADVRIDEPIGEYFQAIRFLPFADVEQFNYLAQ
jgi:hypothetical protein